MNKVNIFLTGVTGFFGRYLLYQFCEANWVNDIYVLIRSKGQENPKSRFNMLLKDPLFISARNQGVSFKNVHVLEGNCLKPKMGLNEHDLKILSKNITLVVHNAASLSFAAKVKKSVQN